jgi:hypothetical protein
MRIQDVKTAELKEMRQKALDYLAEEHTTFEERLAADIAAKDIVAIDRELSIRDEVQRQMDEDTCAEHGVFCCASCFNLKPMA